MPDQPQPPPETTGQRMNRLIREVSPKATRAALVDSFRRTWAKTTKKETPNG